MLLVVTLRCLLNEEAAALYMARREEEENESRNQNGFAFLQHGQQASPMKLGDAPKRITSIWKQSIIFF